MSDATFDQAAGVVPVRRSKAVPAAAVTTSAATIRGEEIPAGTQDWQILVTAGHVRGHRLLDVGKKLFLPALTLGLVGGWLAFSGVGGIATTFRAPPSLVRALTADPAHFAVLPGYEEKGDYRLAWLAGAVGAPQRGLTPQGWQQLIEAAGADVQKHGDRVSDYEATPKLTTTPLVTRPEKALAEHSDKLASGIVAIPHEQGAPGIVAAWVDGRLAVATFAPSPDIGGLCFQVLGPAATRCVAVPPSPDVLNVLRPQEAK